MYRIKMVWAAIKHKLGLGKHMTRLDVVKLILVAIIINKFLF